MSVRSWTSEGAAEPRKLGAACAVRISQNVDPASPTSDRLAQPTYHARALLGFAHISLMGIGASSNLTPPAVWSRRIRYLSRRNGHGFDANLFDFCWGPRRGLGPNRCYKNRGISIISGSDSSPVGAPTIPIFPTFLGRLGQAAGTRAVLRPLGRLTIASAVERRGLSAISLVPTRYSLRLQNQTAQ